MDSREQIIARRGYRPDIVGEAFSLYISSWPSAVKYLASRIGDLDKVLTELCCGVGVTLEHMASSFKRSVGVDVDRMILSECFMNLQTAGVSHNVQLVLGDVNSNEVLQRVKDADVVIYDVPFWSPHGSDLTQRNPDLRGLVLRIRENVSEDVVLFVPPHYSYEDVSGLVGECEYQRVFMDGKHDRNHVYLGGLVNKIGETELRL